MGGQGSNTKRRVNAKNMPTRKSDRNVWIASHVSPFPHTPFSSVFYSICSPFHWHFALPSRQQQKINLEKKAFFHPNPRLSLVGRRSTTHSETNKRFDATRKEQNRRDPRHRGRRRRRREKLDYFSPPPPPLIFCFFCLSPPQPSHSQRLAAFLGVSHFLTVNFF